MLYMTTVAIALRLAAAVTRFRTRSPTSEELPNQLARGVPVIFASCCWSDCEADAICWYAEDDSGRGSRSNGLPYRPYAVELEPAEPVAGGTVEVGLCADPLDVCADPLDVCADPVDVDVDGCAE